MATIRYFAAAAAAAGAASETRDVGSLGELRDQLTDAHGAEFALVLGRCSVLVEGVVSTDPDTAINSDSVVDVLPPFAGG